MKLTAKCVCGCEFSCQTDQMTEDDALGRQFYAEVVMDSWWQRHTGCITTKNEQSTSSESNLNIERKSV